MFHHWTGTRRTLWWRNAVLAPCAFSAKVNHVSVKKKFNPECLRKYVRYLLAYLLVYLFTYSLTHLLTYLLT